MVAKGGPKVAESTGPRTYHTGRLGLIEENQMSMAELADILTNFFGERVLNQTGLTGIYEVKLQWTPDTPLPPTAGADTGAAAEPELSLFTALQEQLGLRLEAQKVPADVVVVDRVERKPTEN